MTKEVAKHESRPDLWADFDRVFNEMNARFFEPFGFGGIVPTVRTEEGLFRPARTDVADTGASYKITAELPGVPKDQLDIRIRGTTVEIRGESSGEKEQTSPAYVYRERVHQGYYRTLELPEAVVGADAKAKVENGLLELELPKEHPSGTPAEVKVRVA